LRIGGTGQPLGPVFGQDRTNLLVGFFQLVQAFRLKGHEPSQGPGVAMALGLGFADLGQGCGRPGGRIDGFLASFHPEETADHRA
jgi:hypothetical protein